MQGGQAEEEEQEKWETVTKPSMKCQYRGGPSMYLPTHIPPITNHAFTINGLIAISLSSASKFELELAELGIGDVDSQWFDCRCLVGTCGDQRPV
jgi:hypothetical protein